jgi:hydrogenase expression/formation protein HypC
MRRITGTDGRSGKMCLAVPGRVVSIEERDQTPMAEVDFGGLKKDVCLQYIPDIQVGEYVMVHVGFAIQRMDEAAAQETLANFEKLGILEEEFGDGFALAAKQAGEDYVTDGHKEADR